MTARATEGRWGRRHWLVFMMFLSIVVGYSDRVNISVAAVAMKEELGWSQTTKGLVLSAFFVGYMAFMYVSGVLSKRYGGKRVLGIAGLWWSVFTLLTPPAAALSVPTLIVARVAMGLGEAAMFPAAIELIGRWVPVVERTRATAIVLSGIPFGTVVGLMATGWIVGHFTWPVAFYAFGVVGLVWTAAWFATIVDDPAEDRRVKPAERALLEAVAAHIAESRAAPSWRVLLLHRSVLALVAAHFALTWTLYMLLTWLPSYFRDVQHVSIASSGLLSAAPWLAMFLVTYAAARLSDVVVRVTGRLALARKLMQSIALVGSGALLLCAQQADSLPEAVAIVCAATGLLGFAWSGYAPNVLDLAPRDAAVLTGFSNTIATIPGVVGVAIAGWLVDLTGTYTAVFAVAATISVVGTLVYVIFGRAQPIID